MTGLDNGAAINVVWGYKLAFEFSNDNDTGVDATAAAANDRMHIVAFEIAAAGGLVYRPRDRQVAAVRRNAYW